jgi:hypothetical protein
MGATRLFVFTFLIAVLHTAAFACGDAVYRPADGSLSVPCFNVTGDLRTLTATLQNTGGNNFVVTDVREVPSIDPLVIAFHVFAQPGLHVATVSGFYGACGGATVVKPTLTQTGDNIDIRVKVRVPPVIGCEVAAVAAQPFSEAVGFFLTGDARTKTYFLNGKPVTPTFGCESSSPPTRAVVVFC